MYYRFLYVSNENYCSCAYKGIQNNAFYGNIEVFYMINEFNSLFIFYSNAALDSHSVFEC